MIGAEPALAAKVLAIANSAAFTCAGKPVTELRKAVLRLGDNLLRSTALSFAMAQLRHQSTLRSIEPRPQSLWKQSPNVAAICYGLARRASLCPDEAFLVGLLHGVGKLYVIVRASNHPRLFEDAAAF